MTPLPLMGALGDMLGLGNMGIPLSSPYIELDMGDATTRQGENDQAEAQV